MDGDAYTPPQLSFLTYLAISYDGGQGGYVLDLRGLDMLGKPVEWETRCLFLQKVEEIIREVRLKGDSSL